MSAAKRQEYATIVADPPWEVKRSSNYRWREGRASGRQMDLPYQTLTVPEIAALPVKEMAAQDAHLYLWTIQSKLRDSFGVAEAWGFRPSYVLVWAKRTTSPIGRWFTVADSATARCRAPFCSCVTETCPEEATMNDASTCPTCGHEFEEGDRYIEDTSSGFLGLDADPVVDGLMADLFGGAGSTIRICEGCTELRPEGGYQFHVYGDSRSGSGR